MFKTLQILSFSGALALLGGCPTAVPPTAAPEQAAPEQAAPEQAMGQHHGEGHEHHGEGHDHHGEGHDHHGKGHDHHGKGHGESHEHHGQGHEHHGEGHDHHGKGHGQGHEHHGKGKGHEHHGKGKGHDHHGKGKGHGHHDFPPAVNAFHDVLAPLWHAAPGPDRQAKTCGGAAELLTRARDMEAAPAPQGVDPAAYAAASNRVSKALEHLQAGCGAGAADFDDRFTAVHHAFHEVVGLMGHEKHD